jgi:hypothetical protein
MLKELTRQRQALQSKIKNFDPLRPSVPAALVAVVDGQKVMFPIDGDSGKVSNLPRGAWGWVRDFLWYDLRDYLKNVHRYEVREVWEQPAAVLG